MYSILSKDAEKIEEQLYIRKSQLQGQIKKELNYKYDMMNSFIGGLVGAIIAFFIDQIVHFFIEFFERIKDGTFFEIDCMDILYGESFIEEIVFIICVLFISYVYCTHAEKNDEKNVFQADMCVYEIKKIDELLEKISM